MRIRKRKLAQGWYPSSEEGVRAFIVETLGTSTLSQKGRARAILAPHAGWYYSGALALRALLELPADLTEIVIMAGHLSAYDPILYYSEDAFESPSGLIEADIELRENLLTHLQEEQNKEEKFFDFIEDRTNDNGIEVFLPFFPLLFPQAKISAFRIPPANSAFIFGKILAELLKDGLKNGSTALIASTDLTHYGPRYGFTPCPSSKEARDWVRNKNDRGFLDALVKGAPAKETLERTVKDNSSCCPGAVAALQIALGEGNPAKLLEHSDSLERGRDDSFVSYAALSWA